MGCSVPTGSESSTPRPVFAALFGPGRSYTLRCLQHLLWLGRSKSTGDFSFQHISYIYIYIMCLTMFRWIRGHTFHPPVTLYIYIYVHSWVLRETGVFYSWTWIIMLFSFLPHFSYQGCFRPNQFEVVWFCDLRPMYYSPVVPWALAWVVSRRESCFHSACKVWPSEISFVILCKTCLALCLCRTASCTVKAHWCRIFSFFFKLLIFNILRFQELVSWV